MEWPEAGMKNLKAGTLAETGESVYSMLKVLNLDFQALENAIAERESLAALTHDRCC